MTVPEQPGSPAGGDFSQVPVKDLMKMYYGWLFPYQAMYKWLSYGNDGKHPQSDGSFFQRREFCFTLENDIFVRYQSFKDLAEMQAAVKDRCPAKIDIGPVYNVDPQRRAAYTGGSSGFAPQERELVFDIDLTDYDDVRTCGKEGHICNKCWPLMAAAVKILDRGLREDFGFEHIFFVFSGRRGVHCWVCDDRARRLSDEQRSAVAAYFGVYRGQEKGLAKLALSLEDHPAVAQAYTLLKEAFEERVLPQQRLLEDAAHMEAVLGYIPSEPLREVVRRAWGSTRVTEEDGDEEEGGLSVARWRALEAAVREEADALRGNGRRGGGDPRAARGLEKGLKGIVFAYAYPRLDMEVSKKMNHLLKAPFCVHPKTGKVCVPIDPADAWEFDPETVPTVGRLLNQLNAAKGSAKTGEEWQATEMAPAVETFQACFLDHMVEAQRSALAAKAREAAAAPTLAW